jgi:predicted transcriptional regulator
MLDLSRDEVTTVVDRLVEELLEAARCQQPPVDAIHLAQEHLGIAVCLDRRQPGRGRAQKAGSGRQIYLKPEQREERHQWTVAHEIGEHLRPRLFERLGLAPGETPPMTGESLANLFAYRLLAPTCWFAEDARNLDYIVPDLKQRYKTASHEVVAWRLLDLPAPCVITIVDNEHVSRRRSNAWPVTRQLASAEKACLEYVHHYSRARCVQADGWTVHGWPVHEPDWRREILRSVFEE